MTSVVFFQREGALCGFEADGHSGFAQAGEDIVCAAVSAVLLTTLNGLEKVVCIEPHVLRRDAKGYLRVTLPTNLLDVDQHQAQLILRVAKAGIEEIEREYPGHVRVMSRKWR